MQEKYRPETIVRLQEECEVQMEEAEREIPEGRGWSDEDLTPDPLDLSARNLQREERAFTRVLGDAAARDRPAPASGDEGDPVRPATD